MTFETFCADETRNFGEQMGKTAASGSVYCLTGDLGVGKTVFTQGFAKGLDVEEKYITSPTFTIINEYEGRLPLYHFDVYRIDDISEMDDTGYEEYFFGDGVCLVEWAELIEEILPEKVKWIKIEKDISKGGNYRKITVKE